MDGSLFPMAYLLQAGLEFSNRLGSSLGLTLQQTEAGFTRFAATCCGGNIITEGTQPSLVTGNLGVDLLDLALCDDALLTGHANAVRVFVQRCLVRMERRNHLLEHDVGLLDLLLLCADLLLCCGNVETVAVDHRRRLFATLGIGRDTVLGGENAVAEILYALAQFAHLAVEFVNTRAVARKLRLLLRDLGLVNPTGRIPLLKLLPDGGELIGKLAVVLLREMDVENPQILHEGLISTCFRCLTLERTNLAAHFLDDVLYA